MHMSEQNKRPSRRVGSRIPMWPYRALLFAVLTTAWISGLAFFVLNNWITVEGEFGPEKHPWQFAVLRTHGAAAFLMMISFGYLLASHVPAGWRTGRVKKSGISLVASVAFMVLSAYILYYASDLDFRHYLVYAHVAVGFSLPFQVTLHIVQGKLRERSRVALSR